MKTKVLGAAACVLLAAPAFSQCVSASADIPFSFHVANTEFAAGKYHVANPIQGACSLVSVTGTRVVSFVVQIGMESKATPGRGALIFHRYGDTNFPSALRNPGAAVEWALGESKEEHAFATTTVSYPVVVIAITR